ncbi:undecaprenyl-phosphate alpha-N-acetylglucosaminyl 1-phosphate transferase [Alginatibacterium sediminis]|uniref:Undecaprenyl-phosphate alpha-N-acetylglucosaminyl 1-phosphate transferase n=1 Tax=Alginatibacterium sediminis TaxID=2164068 RepID=A0A420EAW3_9ALTE|nr:UDP-N-acetylglucosamine--undecaprenyl-phosphate N-acetylglucosaminephosphotransferase [Alginatibacterium sediminis]RKF17828.1 undecaprenyl-phosphate alpha-N-acetylglucosaminyl 1-phosphate transferase [Alginatibacterium sediminis]
MFSVFLDIGFQFFFSLTTLFFLRKIAQRVGLVDRPNQRKLHNGEIPLVGGLSICISILSFIYYQKMDVPHQNLYAISISILVFVGVIDDKYDLSVKIRLLVQTCLSIAMMYFADLQLTHLGNMFGIGQIDLGWLGSLVTIIAVIGAINAFNMVDGIDGLLGGLATVTFTSLAIIFSLHGESLLAYLCMMLVVIILPYILLNLGFLGRKHKVFMGDAGSMLIGFTVIWLLLAGTQAPGNGPIRPVAALWFIAVPLMDMAAIMIRRIRRGDSPFKPDREHLHHICQRLGFNSGQTLCIICLVASLFAGFGIIGEQLHIPESVMFMSFIIIFACYIALLNKIWVITAWLRSK